MKTLNNKTRQHSVLRMIAVFVTTLLLMPTVVVANTTFYVYDNVKTVDKTLKLYVWESGGSNIGWPGIEVTTTGSCTTNGWTYQISTEKIDGIDWFKVEFTNKTPTNAILLYNDNSDQTQDLNDLSSGYYLIYNGAQKGIVYSNATAAVNCINGKPTVTLRGGYNSWTANDIMTSNADNTDFTLTIPAKDDWGEGFKFVYEKDGTLTYIGVPKDSNPSITLWQEITGDSTNTGKNFTFTDNLSEEYTFHLWKEKIDENTSTWKFTVKGNKGPSSGHTVKLRSGFEGSSDVWYPYTMDYNLSDDEYTYTVSKSAITNTDVQFKITIEGDDGNDIWYGYEGSDNNIDLTGNTGFTISPNSGSNIKVQYNMGYSSYKFKVKKEGNDWKAYVVATGTYIPTFAIYTSSNINGVAGEWETDAYKKDAKHQFTYQGEENGLLKYTLNINNGDVSVTDCYFRIGDAQHTFGNNSGEGQVDVSADGNTKYYAGPKLYTDKYCWRTSFDTNTNYTLTWYYYPYAIGNESDRTKCYLMLTKGEATDPVVTVLTDYYLILADETGNILNTHKMISSRNRNFNGGDGKISTRFFELNIKDDDLKKSNGETWNNGDKICWYIVDENNTTFYYPYHAGNANGYQLGWTAGGTHGTIGTDNKIEREYYNEAKSTTAPPAQQYFYFNKGASKSYTFVLDSENSVGMLHAPTGFTDAGSYYLVGNFTDTKVNISIDPSKESDRKLMTRYHYLNTTPYTDDEWKTAGHNIGAGADSIVYKVHVDRPASGSWGPLYLDIASLHSLKIGQTTLGRMLFVR